MKGKCVLDADAVRQRALSVPGCRFIDEGADRNVCCFLVGLSDDDNRDVEKLARINVYLDTGTVASCRVLHGQVRQTFRRSVTSLDIIERLLRHPPDLARIDDSLVSLNDNNRNNNKGFPTSSSLKAELELAVVGQAILENEKEKLETHLEALEQQQDDDDLSTDVSSPSSLDNFLMAPASSSHMDHSESSHMAEASHTEMTAGMEFQFSLPKAAMKHVDQCLKDINDMDKFIVGVATNGRGTVFLYGRGGVAYTPNIPRPLYQKLSTLRSSATAARPSYVSLGTRDRFFVSFMDGTYAFKGPKGLDKELKKCPNGRPPRSVAFGSTYDTFFLVRHDGSWTYQGRGIAEDMEQKLEERGDAPDLVCATLSPDGHAWFLKAGNGRMWWGGITDDLDENISDILSAGNFLNFVDFGEDGSYFVSYDE